MSCQAPSSLSLTPNYHGVRQLEFDGLGTRCTISFRHPDEREAAEFASEALAWMRVFEAKFSRFRPDSMVSRVNAAAGGDWIRVDSEMEHMLNLADDLHRRSHGIFDPTLLPLIRMWDWQSVHFKLPAPSKIKAKLALTGWPKVERAPGLIRLPKVGMGLDFGGFGKEYAADQLAKLAIQRGISDALINLGRDVFAIGGNGQTPFWDVGIEDGNKPGHCWGGLAVSNFAASSSGGYQRSFMLDGVRHSHILDPRTGWPVANGMRAVTAIAPSCLQAGLYSMAVFVLGLEDGLGFAAQARRGVEVCAQSETRIEGTRNFRRYLVQAA
jgi:thiamine biosynthesis lipoprotein